MFFGPGLSSAPFDSPCHAFNQIYLWWKKETLRIRAIHAGEVYRGPDPTRLSELSAYQSTVVTSNDIVGPTPTGGGRRGRLGLGAADTVKYGHTDGHTAADTVTTMIVWSHSRMMDPAASS
jgi:hypothetical protein